MKRKHDSASNSDTNENGKGVPVPKTPRQNQTSDASLSSSEMKRKQDSASTSNGMNEIGKGVAVPKTPRQRQTSDPSLSSSEMKQKQDSASTSNGKGVPVPQTPKENNPPINVEDLVPSALRKFHSSMEEIAPLHRLRDFKDAEELKDIADDERGKALGEFMRSARKLRGQLLLDLVAKLDKAIEKATEDIVKINQEHMKMSESILEHTIKFFCAEFKDSIERHIKSNPKMGLKELEKIFLDEKANAVQSVTDQLEKNWKYEIVSQQILKLEGEIAVVQKQFEDKLKPECDDEMEMSEGSLKPTIDLFCEEYKTSIFRKFNLNPMMDLNAINKLVAEEEKKVVDKFRDQLKLDWREEIVDKKVLILEDEIKQLRKRFKDNVKKCRLGIVGNSEKMSE